MSTKHIKNNTALNRLAVRIINLVPHYNDELLLLEEMYNQLEQVDDITPEQANEFGVELGKFLDYLYAN